jgi:hypothetical protein
MDAVREAWTDERLDDLARRMDQGFDRVDKDLRELCADMAAGHHGLRTDITAARSELKAEMDTRFDRLEARFDSMQRMTLGAYVTAVLGLIATQL